MANAYITFDKYEDLLKRVEKVENQYSDLEKFKEKVIEVEFLNKEIKAENKEIKTEFTAEFRIIQQRFDYLNDSINQRFDSMGRETSAMWRIQIPIFVAILIMMFRLFGVI